MPNKIEDISIDDLEKTDWISARAINICRKNRLTSLSEIITFYKNHGSFKNIENCGDKTEKELSELCKKFRDHSLDLIITEINERNEIKKLVKRFTNLEIEITNNHIEYLTYKLSVRAKNGLKTLFNGIPQVNELIEKICSSTFSFRTIRNIGEKKVLELNNFAESLLQFLKNFQFQDNDTNIEENKRPLLVTDVDVDFAKIIHEFSPFKRAALNRHIEYLVSNLKKRAKNGITQFFGETFTAKEIIETIYSYSFDFRNIKNIGIKTVSELNDFKSDISSFIETLRVIEEDQLGREYAKLIVKTNFSNLLINFNEHFETVFDDTGKIRLFKLLNFLTENGHILKLKEKHLFNFLYTESYNKSLEQIAIELDLGKERLRQIKIIFENEAQGYFRFILNFNLQDVISYNISEDARFKVIDKDFVQKINATEEVNFNILFYSIIFGLFLENSHSVLGDEENISGKGNYSNTIRYKNCYLIQKVLFNSFDFKIFANDINIHLSGRITESYALHFEGYLLQFTSQEGKKYLPYIKEICEAIIYYEFDLVVNNEGYIVFERNVRKPTLQYILETLEGFGQMSKVEEITRAISEKYPELEINEQAVRSTLQREKKHFIFIGRTSTYGLKKWELENKSIKGGTIRDIAEEYLEKYDKPRHTYDIVNYIKQFRDTTALSIFRNIEAETNNRFIIFNGGYIGLKNKFYAPSDMKFKRVAGINFRKNILMKFNGWKYEKVISYYTNTHNYTPVQVINSIQAKIQSGEIILNKDNTLTI